MLHRIHLALFLFAILLVYQPASCAIHKHAFKVAAVAGDPADVSPIFAPAAEDAPAETTPFRNQQESAPTDFSAEETAPVDRLQYLEDAPLSSAILEKAAADLWSTLIEVKIAVEASEDLRPAQRDRYSQSISASLQDASTISDELGEIGDETTVEAANRMQEMLATIRAGYKLEETIREEMKQGSNGDVSEAAATVASSGNGQNAVWTSTGSEEESIAIAEHRLQELPIADDAELAPTVAATEVPTQSDGLRATDGVETPVAEDELADAVAPVDDDDAWDEEDYDDYFEDENDLDEAEAAPPSQPGSGLLAGGPPAVSLVEQGEAEDTLDNTISEALKDDLIPQPQTKDTASEEAENDSVVDRASGGVRASAAALALFLVIVLLD